MPPRPERPRLARLAAVAAVGAVVIWGASLIPGTSGAFSAAIVNTADTAASKSLFTCGDTFATPARQGSAYFEFTFADDAGSTTAVDSSAAGDTGAYAGANAKDAADPIACPADRGAAYALDGSTSRVTTARYDGAITTGFSEELWFRTSATTGGKLLGYEGTQVDRSNNYDKHLYVGADGLLYYGIYNGGTSVLTSGSAVTDGVWHHAAATTSSDGSSLYLDGRLVASSASMTNAEGFGGYWRIGEGNLTGWPSAPSNWFTGSIRYAAAYSLVLTPQQIAADASFGAPGSRTTKAGAPVATSAPQATPTPTPTPTDTAAPTTTPAPTDSPAATATPVPAPTRARVTDAPVETAAPVPVPTA